MVLIVIYLGTFFLFSFFTVYIESILTRLGILGVFFSGSFYTYSFTSGIGTGTFILLADTYSPVFLAILGGVGAGLADLSILFLFKEFNLNNELNLIKQEKWVKHKILKHKIFSSKIFLTVSGIIVLGSPAPDEIGIILIEKGNILSERYLFITAFIANALGIYLITSLF